MALHTLLQPGDIHLPYNWVYADAAERSGATGFISTDIGKFARQLDDNSIWMLTAVTPTWVVVINVVPQMKTGTVVPGSFSGIPARATVTFSSAFSGTNYVILLGAVTPTGVNIELNPQPENKTASGFVINLGTGRLDNLVEVGWQAIVY